MFVCSKPLSIKPLYSFLVLSVNSNLLFPTKCIETESSYRQFPFENIPKDLTVVKITTKAFSETVFILVNLKV